jgi:predicted amidophosphoribosyltransferase
MECPQCHSAVRVGSKFCGECGTAMAKHCTNCNADLSATSKFCAECGTPVNPPPA